MRDLIRAFYALRDARFGVAVAEQALSRRRPARWMAAERFSAGQIGLSEWQAAQRAERQAQLEAAGGAHRRRPATERLARSSVCGRYEAGRGDPALRSTWSMISVGHGGQVVENDSRDRPDVVLELISRPYSGYLEAVRSRARSSRNC